MPTQFHQSTTATETPCTSHNTTHYRAADPRSDVLVPLFLALITGVMAALITTWLWWELELPDWLPILAFFAGFGFVWIWRLRQHDALLTAAEEITRLDLNRDGNIGQPMPETETARSIHIDLSVQRPNHPRPTLLRFDLPCTRSTLEEVADAMLAGSALPESEWAGLKNGKPFSESSLKKFKLALVTNGLAKWMNPQNPKLGLVLSDDGKTFMRQVIDRSLEDEEDGPTPPLQK